jgi:hypothetical protein
LKTFQEAVKMTNDVKTRKLSRQQDLCIQSLLSGKKVMDACKDAKVSRQAYYVWVNDETFLQELDRRRSEVIENSMEKLRSLMTQAVDKLETLLKSDNEEIARKSANSIIEYSLKWGESEDVESRLDEVERLFLERKTYSRG